MDLRIAGKNALITGGSRGLGRQAALALAGEGVNIAICARGASALAATVSELEQQGVRAIGIQADITDGTSTARAYADAVAALGPIDILVNNAGGSVGGAFEETNEDQIAEAFRLNLGAALQLTRLVLPGMRERAWGRVINIASIYGREHGGSFGYMSAKAALIAATKHIALQVAKDGVCVNSIAPGSILFEGGGWDRFVKNQPKDVVDAFIRTNLPMGKFGWPEPVGDLVAYLASERAGLITGACFNIDGGQSKSLI